MDDAGNILIRRYSKTNVYIKSTASNPNDETAIGAEILKLPNNAIESEKIVKVSESEIWIYNIWYAPSVESYIECARIFSCIKCQLNYTII